MTLRSPTTINHGTVSKQMPFHAKYRNPGSTKVTVATVGGSLSGIFSTAHNAEEDIQPKQGDYPHNSRRKQTQNSI